MLSDAIIKAVAVTAELTGTRLTDVGTEAMVEHLSGYDTSAVLAALHRCQLELRSALTLGAIMDRLDDGHPGPETAWAMVGPLSEDDSIVWTQEIATAHGTVRALLATDPIAARMAFLETYRRLIGEARSQRRAPVWSPSLGFNVSGRAAVLEAAVEQGRLPMSRARELLPPHEWPHAWNTTSALPDHTVERGEIKALIAGVLDRKPSAREESET